ncbi:MAG: 50S ribosomal protein L3 [Patescibacteria group bacterium]
MTKLTGKKMKMTQLWKSEISVPVTAIRLNAGAPIDELKEGDKVKVTGKTRGRGFQGVVKRYRFHGGPKSHGQKDRLRAPGSNGPTAPQRTIKGRRMGGHMGNVKMTVRNLTVAGIEKEGMVVFLKGAVPGFAGGTVELRK